MSQGNGKNCYNRNELGNGLSDFESSFHESFNVITESLGLLETPNSAVGIDNISICSDEFSGIIASSTRIELNDVSSTANGSINFGSDISSPEMDSHLQSKRKKRDDNTNSGTETASFMEMNGNNSNIERDTEISDNTITAATSSQDISTEVEDDQASVKNYEFSTTIFDTDYSSDSEDESCRRVKLYKRDTNQTNTPCKAGELNFDEHSFSDYNLNIGNAAPITPNSSRPLFIELDDNQNVDNDVNSDNDNLEVVSSVSDNLEMQPSFLLYENDENSVLPLQHSNAEDDPEEILNLSRNPVVLRYVQEGLLHGNNVSNILDDVVEQHNESTHNIEQDFSAAGDFLYELSPFFVYYYNDENNNDDYANENPN